MKRFLSFLITTVISLHAQEAEEIAALTLSTSPALEKIELPPLPTTRSYKSPLLAATLSIIPGLGHLYLGDTKEALTLAGSFGAGRALIALSDYSQQTARTAGVMTCETAWCYGIYASYRDARLHNSDIDYSYKMPTDSFSDLSQAPFRLSILKKPEVWGGLLCDLGAAVGLTYLMQKYHVHHASRKAETMLSPMWAFPVGLSEEALFRGYLQSHLAEATTPWGGIVLSSLAFGAAHVPNGRYMSSSDRKSYYRFSIPFITAGGLYYGWVTYKNRSLQEAVALHSWYDFVIFALSAGANRIIIGGEQRVEWTGGF